MSSNREVHALGSDDDDIEILNEAQLNRDKALAMMPNLFGKTEAALETPKTELLPFRVWPKKSSYKITISRPKQNENFSKEDEGAADTLNISVNETGERLVQHIHNGSQRPNRRFYNPIVRSKGKKSKGQKVKNSKTFTQQWRGFCPNTDDLIIPVIPNQTNKRSTVVNSITSNDQEPIVEVPEIITLSDDEGDSKLSDILLEGPLKTLWSIGNSTPMIKPSQAKSTKAIFSALTVKHPIMGIETSQIRGTQFKISFDVYSPNVHFKKSAPRPPNFRVVVTNYDTNVPTEKDLAATMADIYDKVPLMFGIVSQSDMAFFSFNPVCLPTDITMG